MGLKWLTYSRYRILGWEHGPYRVQERRGIWRYWKTIATFERSLQSAQWLVQEYDPNSIVTIILYPREQGRPPADVDRLLVSHRSYYGGSTRVDNSDRPVPVASQPMPALPSGYTPIGQMSDIQTWGKNNGMDYNGLLNYRPSRGRRTTR